jgi:hypothetical protein
VPTAETLGRGLRALCCDIRSGSAEPGQQGKNSAVKINASGIIRVPGPRSMKKKKKNLMCYGTAGSFAA